MDRRALLEWMVATGGLAAFNRLSAQDLGDVGTQAHERVGRAMRAPGLTARETRTVAAVAECIIPRTDTLGASDARVSAFVAVMLVDWYPAADAARFRAGLSALEVTSRARFGAGFADAASAQRIQLARELDDEVVAIRRAHGARANAHWFAMLKYLTVWGYCTSAGAMRDVFRSIPRPMRYDGAAPFGGDA